MGLNLLNLDDEKFKDVTVGGYEFRIRCIFPKDRAAIVQRRMRLQGGNPVEALMTDDFTLLENIATVDACTEKFPKEFKATESCINWDDESLIHELADEIKKHTADIQDRLKKNRPTS
jgi:hypothetical protein